MQLGRLPEAGVSMQNTADQPSQFPEPPRNHVPLVISGNSNAGGSKTLCNQNLKDLMVNLQGVPRISAPFLLKSDMENMQPLASMQASSGFVGVAKSLEYKGSYQNSSHFINQFKAAATKAQMEIHDPGVLSRIVSHSNPAYEHSWPGISSSACSLSSLDAMEHQLLSELGILRETNSFSSTSPLTAVLCGLSKSGDSGSLPGYNPQYGGERAISSQPSMIYHSKEAFSTPYGENEPTDSHAVSQQLARCAFSKTNVMHDQDAWSAPLLEQIYDNVMNSLRDEVSEALVIGSSSSGLVEMEADIIFGGIPINNMPATSQVSYSSTVRESSNSASMLYDDKKRMMNTPLQVTLSEDLYGSLGLNFKRNHGLPFWDDSLLSARDGNPANFDAGLSTSVPELDANSLLNIDRSYPEICSENLLDAVVAKVQSVTTDQHLGEKLSNSTLAKTSSSSMYNSQVQYGKHSPEKENVDSPQFPPDASAEKGPHFSTNVVPSMSHVSSWIEGSHSVSAEISVIEKKADETCKTGRKRARPGESTRPRPKDRQQIQDRVKELREIVPNGAKCSIDALLDRTIKHMVFLQSVAKHADKLKHAREPKCGATWAFELGHQSVVSPIIVEDLNQPGQMLIEMLCEERGFFLEIADIIRGFGLTILKGVMEARSGKIWAHFMVEANRDVTRMDVFMSLVQLLDQTTKSSASPCSLPSGVNGNGAPIFPAFHETAVPPIIRVAERFQ